MRVRYDDLLGTPYQYRANLREDGKTDCIGIGTEVFLRAGWSVAYLPDREGVFAEQVAMLEQDPTAHPWEQVEGVVHDRKVVGRLEFGDVVICVKKAAVHASVVVDESRQVTLSSAENHGCYACAAGVLGGVSGVYRLKEAYR